MAVRRVAFRRTAYARAWQAGRKVSWKVRAGERRRVQLGVYRECSCRDDLPLRRHTGEFPTLFVMTGGRRRQGLALRVIIGRGFNAVARGFWSEETGEFEMGSIWNERS